MSSTDSALVERANSILARTPGAHPVRTVAEINARFFVSLYEGLFAETLPDVIAQPKTAADEAHNVQSVIDTLSLDILNTSLSHLSGDAIVSGNRAAIKSLLEVFEWLFEYILERIGSEASSEFGEGEQTRDLDDPDLVTSEVIDSILERELGRSKGRTKNQENGTSKVTFASGTKRGGDSSCSRNSTAELIALGSEHSRELSGASPDKTADLIALGDSRYLNSLTPPATTRGTGTSAARHPPVLNGTTPPTRGPSAPRATQTATYPTTTLQNSAGGSLASLSTGPLSSDTASRISDGTDSRHSQGFKSTAELLRESADLERRFGSLTAEERAAQQQRLSSERTATNGSALLESSLASSSAFPRPLSARELSENSTFRELGSRPLNTRPAYDSLSASMPAGHQSQFHAPSLMVTVAKQMLILLSIQSYDSLSSSMPVGHQYHSFTHHLYHHYDPVQNALDPLSQSLPARPVKSGKMTRDTQVTPGRFLQSQSTAPAAPGVVTETASSSTGQAQDSRRRDVPGARSSRAKAESYDNLRQMLQDTMDLSRDALRTHPSATSRLHSPPKADPGDEDLVRRLSEISPVARETLQKLHASEESGADGTQKPRAASKPPRQQNVQGILSPARRTGTRRSQRKVSFLTSRESTTTDTSPGSPVRARTTSGVVSSPAARRHRAATTLRSSPARHTRHTRRPPRALPGRSVSLSPAKRPSTTTEEEGGESPVFRNADDDLSAPSKRLEVLEEVYRRLAKRRRRRQRRFRIPTDDTDCLSDGVVDYRPDDDGSYHGDFAAELAAYKRKLLARGTARALNDRFEEAGRGPLGGVRRALRKEARAPGIKTQLLSDQYGDQLADYEEKMLDTMSKGRTQAAQVDKNYKKKMTLAKNRANRRNKVHGGVLWQRNYSSKREATRSRKRTHASGSSLSSALAEDKDFEGELLPSLLEEFPFLHVSPETLHRLWERCAKHTQAMGGDVTSRARKTKQQQAIEEAEWKQKLLAEIARKQVEHNKRLRELEERRAQQVAVRATVRDKRLQHARVRKYYEEYAVRMRSKMLKKRTREEMVFRKLLEDGLSIQRERMRDLRKYSRDQREQRSRRQRDQIDSMENFYRDRFQLLTEALEKERQERNTKSKAQQQVLKSLDRELRQKTEREIEALQDEIFRDDDDAYFRQLDADRLRQELQLSKYKALA